LARKEEKIGAEKMDKQEKKNNPNEKPSGYCQITRERVDNFIKIFEDFKNNDFKSLVREVKQMGKRPSWAVSTIIWILSSLAVGLLVRAIIMGIK